MTSLNLALSLAESMVKYQSHLTHLALPLKQQMVMLAMFAWQ